jgi:SAM-dependent methyltransferase
MFKWFRALNSTGQKKEFIDPAEEQTKMAQEAPPSLIDSLLDSDIEAINQLLPWAAFTLDRRGRRLGHAHSMSKRAEPQKIPDPRIVELDRRFRLRGQKVLELGCFEGIHSAGLALMGADVLAVDSRIENVAKTAVRCGLMQLPVKVLCWNVESEVPAGAEVDCDVLHHVGVLYHLENPVEHMAALLPKVRRAVMLDTHVAPEGAGLVQYSVGGRQYQVYEYAEGGRQDPFSGMYSKARWLREADLCALLSSLGFSKIDVAERRAERNGPRVLIFAERA